MDPTLGSDGSTDRDLSEAIDEAADLLSLYWSLVDTSSSSSPSVIVLSN